jgi:hypothetical protein
VGVVGERDPFGSAHLTLIPLEILGLSLIAAAFPWRRVVAIALVAGCIVDFALGVFVQARVEALENTPRQTVFAAGLNLASASLQPTRNPLSPTAWTNWYAKCHFALSRQALVSLASYRSPDAETERMASHTRSQLQRVQDEDAVSWQGWWGRHGSTLDFLGDDVAGESGEGAAVPQAVLVILFLALLGALLHKMRRQMRPTSPRPVPLRAPPRRSRR